jgi:UDP-N-acetyl-D-mannosaminuronic acid dehydrogenase
MVVEPNVKEHNVFKLTNYKDAYERADIVVFLVNHKEFSELNYRDEVEVLDFCGTFKK